MKYGILFTYDCDDTDDSDEEGDSKSIPVNKTLVSASVKEVCTEDSSAIEKDIKVLSKGFICPGLEKELSILQQSIIKLETTSVSMYVKTDDKPSEQKSSQKHLKKKLHSKHNPFVEVVVGA